MNLQKNSLKSISDGLCNSELDLYDFDKIDNNRATVDGLLIRDEVYFFIEFKNLEFISLLDWLKSKCINENKCKCNKENILLKVYESYFIYRKLNSELDSKEKWFIFVYSSNESSNSNKKFKEYFTKVVLNRLKKVYNEVRVLECEKFIKFLRRINVF